MAAQNSTTTQHVCDGTYEELPIKAGSNRFLLYATGDLQLNMGNAVPADATSFPLLAGAVLDWSDQTGVVSGKGAVGVTVYCMS